MLDQLIGLLLLGLGLRYPSDIPNIKGDSTEVSSSSGSGSGSGSSGVTFTVTTTVKPTETEQETEQETEPTGATIRELQEANIRHAEANLEQVFEQRRLRLENEVKRLREEEITRRSVERANFQAKLSDIKNKEKKTAVVTIDAKITQINTKRTDLMLKNLAKMQEILDKIMVRAAEAKKAGRDISKVESAVTAARASIATAIAAVTTQSGKSYIPTITTEQNLGQSVKTAMQSFESDMKSVYELVKTARQGVATALSELGKVLTGLLPTTTPTPSI